MTAPAACGSSGSLISASHLSAIRRARRSISDFVRRGGLGNFARSRRPVKFPALTPPRVDFRRRLTLDSFPLLDFPIRAPPPPPKLRTRTHSKIEGLNFPTGGVPPSEQPHALRPRGRRAHPNCPGRGSPQPQAARERSRSPRAEAQRSGALVGYATFASARGA